MNTVNWAILAPGNIARSFATALQGVDKAKLYSVASRQPEKAMAFAHEFGFETSAKSFADLLADPRVDVIYIASPHAFHAAQSIACLEAGKAVLCEKPMTLNAIQARHVFDVAKRRNLFYMEAVWTRFMPVLAQLRKWLDEGAIGEVEMVQANFCFSMPFDASHRMFDKSLGGGALLDLGIYPITFAQWLMQQAPTQVAATGVIGKSGVDEKNIVTLKYPNGVLASLTSGATANASNDAWIFGSKGKIKIPDFWHCQEAMLFRDDAQPVGHISIPHRINGYEYEIEEVHRCLKAGLIESPDMSWQESLGVMAIMDQVRGQIGLEYQADLDKP